MERLFLTLKMSILQSRHISDFSKGKVENLKSDFSLFLVKIQPQILFADVLERRQGFPDYKNVHFTESP